MASIATGFLSGISNLKTVLYWNRVMSFTWSFIGVVTPLNEITAFKDCAVANPWQGWIWVGLCVIGLLGALGELFDDFATDTSFGDEDDADDMSTIKCELRQIGRGWLYIGRFFSNCLVMGATLMVIAAIYLKDPSCWVAESVEPSENFNPAFNSSNPSTFGVPFASPPTAIKERQKNMAVALFALLTAMTVTVVLRIACCSYVKPAKEESLDMHRLPLCSCDCTEYPDYDGGIYDIGDAAASANLANAAEAAASKAREVAYNAKKDAEDAKGL